MDQVLQNIEHQKEIQKFLNFFKLKRSESLREIEAASKEVIVEDEVLSKEEAQELLERLTKVLTNSFEQELALVNRMSALYAQMLLLQAENENLEFHADTSFLDNQKAIQDMAAIEREEKLKET